MSTSASLFLLVAQNLQLVVFRRDVEEEISLRGFRWRHLARISDPILHALAVGRFGVADAGVIDQFGLRNNGLAAAGIELR